MPRKLTIAQAAEAFLDAKADADPHPDATPPQAAQPAPQPGPQPSAQHTAAPPGAQRRRRAAPEHYPAAVLAKTKATIRLPAETARRLRAWTGTNGRTIADTVLSAYLEHGDELRRSFEGSPRLRLGLAAVTEDGPKVPVFLRATPAALAELDAAAADLQMTRSSLVAALLSRHLS